jgi:hypothetical protein
MTELEKIAYAKSFIDKLANGINPIDDSIIPDGDVVNNVRLSRCFFYVSDVLRQVIDNGGTTPAPMAREKKPKKLPYTLSLEQAEQFEYSDTPITATEMLNRIIAVGPQDGVKKFPKRNLTKWLLCLDLIEEVEINNTRIRRPTDSGKELGILLEERQGQYGSYYVILYNRDAQQFIIDNIEAILAFDNEKYREKMHLDNQGKPWDGEQDEKLVALFNEGFSVREIARALKRGEKAIRIRLRHKGIDLDTIIEAKSFEVKAETPVPQMNEGIKEIAKAEITCQSCRFARSGDCFPQKEICADYEKAYDVPKDERAAWPEMGDASYLRQNGRHR